MARRVCTTTPGDSTCCRAASQGLLNRPFQLTMRNGAVRCASCSTATSTSRNPAKAGRTIFVFRWQKNASCGIGPHGCAALAQGGAASAIGLGAIAPGQTAIQVPAFSR